MAQAQHALQRYLMTAPWMPALPPSLVDQVMHAAYETTHAAHEVIGRRDERAHAWLGVQEGQVKLVTVLRSGKVVRFADVVAGGWIDTAAIARGAARQYDVVAIRRSRIVHIPVDVFGRLLCCPAFAGFIIRQLGEVVCEFMGILAAERATDPVVRLARAISGFCGGAILPHAGSTLSISQEALGELAGLTRQRTNHAVKHLERDGVLQVRYGGLLVRDLEALRRYGDST